MRTRLIGVVTSDRNSKTRRVNVERLYQHKKYKKIVRGRTVCYVHDENNDSKMGDMVEIVESRPHSKTKRWELLRVVNSTDDVAAQLLREEKAEETQTASEEVSTLVGDDENTADASAAEAGADTATNEEE